MALRRLYLSYLGILLFSGLLAFFAIPLSHAGSVFQGGKIYVEHCETCHGANGRGIPGVPDLTRGRGLLRPDTELFQIVNNGKGAMPGYAGVLRNEQILDVLAYMRTLR